MSVYSWAEIQLLVIIASVKVRTVLSVAARSRTEICHVTFGLKHSVPIKTLRQVDEQTGGMSGQANRQTEIVL